MARKILLLQGSQSEVLVLTSRSLMEAWPLELAQTLESCARRGLRVRVLVEAGLAQGGAYGSRLREAGVELRQATRRLPLRNMPLQGEIWVIDRSEVLAVNERRRERGAEATHAVAFLLGSEVAHGASAYFDLRWGSGVFSVAFSVRHKSYAFHSGQRSTGEFFGCLLRARESVALSLPGARLAKSVAGALHAALASGISVTIYVNAEREDAPALKRLRRLAAAGAVLKICGRRLASECAVVDGQHVYMGSLPAGWRPWNLRHEPVFLLQNAQLSGELLQALESQVSVELRAQRAERTPLTVSARSQQPFSS